MSRPFASTLIPGPKKKPLPVDTRRVLLLWFCFVASLCCHAGQSSYRLRLWQVEDGLPHNSVQAITQSADGYLWIGTGDGLVRFDGVRFTSVSIPANNAKGLSVTALYESADRALWIGLEHAGLFRLKDGDLQKCASSTGNLRGGVRQIVAGAGGIFVGTGRGMHLLKGTNLVAYAPHPFLTNAVRAIATAESGELFVGTGNGFALVRGKSARVYQQKDGLLNSSVRDLLMDGDGSIWIATEEGLSRFKEGTFAHWTTKENLPGNFITSLLQDQSGNLWIGSYNGLAMLAHGKGTPFLDERGAALDPVRTLYEDAEGTIWVGTKGGLYSATQTRFAALTKEDGLNHKTILSVKEDHAGRIWVGTLSGGLNCISNGNILSMTKADGLSSDLVLALGESRDGTIWVGSDHVGGLNAFRSNSWVHYGREHQIYAGVTAIEQGRAGTVWIGTRSGLFRLEQNATRIQKVSRQSGLQAATINALKSHQGTMWIGADRGLCRFAGGRFIHVTDAPFTNTAVTAVFVDQANTLWIGTRGRGLWRYAAGKFTGYSSENGLFHDTVYEVVEDDQGSFWISSPKGIYCIRRSDFFQYDAKKIQRLVSVHFGKLDGVLSTECVGAAKPAACKSSDGRLWFATAKGLVVANPSVPFNQRQPPVHVEELSVNKTRYSFSGDEKRSGRIVLEPGAAEIEFFYTALSLRLPEKNRFKYKLEKHDPDWIEAGNRRSAIYGNLKPGTYRFRVLACNNDGVWNEQGAELEIVLRPFAWQTWWFRGVFALGGIGLVGGAGRYLFARNLQRKLELLERERAVESERTRIARDMHDDLGSRVTEALLACGQAQQRKHDPFKLDESLERISSAIREMADHMDALVWAVNPRNDSLDKVMSYIQEYTHNLLDLTDIRYRFEFSSQTVPNQPVPSEVRHNLLLVLKEALNNSIKYSEASEIFIRIESARDRLTVSIEDNGKGFSLDSVSECGNGLSNMQKRLKPVGGDCVISSSPGLGTTVAAMVPLRQII